MTEGQSEKNADPAGYDSFIGKVVSGFAWQTATKIVVQSLGWISTVIVARLLQPADYGLIAIVGIFNGLLALIVELGLAHGLIQQPTVTRRQADGIFYFSMALGLAAYALLYAAAPLIAGFYDLDVLTPLLRVAGISLILGSVKTVPFALVMRDMDFRYRSIVEMLSNFAGIAVVLVLAFLGYGVWSLLWSYLAIHAVTAIAYIRLMDHIPRLKFSLSEIGSTCVFGFKVTVNNLLYFVHSEADLFIISKILGAKILGVYSMAMQLARIPIEKIGEIFSQVAFPAVSRIADDDAAVRKLYLDLHRNLLIVAFPMLVGLALVADELVILLLTEKWSAIIPILQVFCILNLLRVSSVLVRPALYGRGRPDLMMRYYIAAVVVIPAAVFIGSQFGLEGILVAWCIAFPCVYVLLMHFCLRNLQLGAMTFIRSFSPAFVASAVMAVAVLSVQFFLSEAADPYRLTASILTGVISYLAAIIVLFRNDAKSFMEGLSRLRSSG